MIIGADTPIGQSFELTTRIKAAQPETICILISGNPADALRASEAGADAFLLKPYGVVIFSLLCRHLLWNTRGGEVKKVDERLPERVTLSLPVDRFHCGGARVRG